MTAGSSTLLMGAERRSSSLACGAGMSSSKTVHGGQTLGAILRHTANMPKAPSQIFELELEESCKCVRVDDNDSGLGDIADEVASLCQAKTAVEYQLWLDVEAAMPAPKARDDRVVEAADLAPALCALGYRALLRTALGGGCGNTCLTNLRHTFLLCTPAGASTRSGAAFIVDPRFRESFEVAKPTPRYRAALSAVPAVFVGHPDALAALVVLLCAEMRDAFAAHGAVLPPWRQADSMLSKWRPRRSLDETVYPAASGTAAPQVGQSPAAGQSPPGPVHASPPDRPASASPDGQDDWRCFVNGGAGSDDGSASGGRRGGLSARLNAHHAFGLVAASAGGGGSNGGGRCYPAVPWALMG